MAYKLDMTGQEMNASPDILKTTTKSLFRLLQTSIQHLLIASSITIFVSGCSIFSQTSTSVTTVTCDNRGGSTLFVADFDSDTVGSPPAVVTNATLVMIYGPPGASLNISGPPNSAIVVNSNVLSSKALKITRQQFAEVNVAAVLGNNGTATYQAGTYYLEFMAHGDLVPSHLIAGAAISSRSAENGFAYSLKLFDTAYHERQQGNYSLLAGSYDVSDAHFVHVELNMDEKQYSICIDDEIVTSNQQLLEDDFTNIVSLHFFMPQMITEAFPSAYVVDDIRVTK